MQPEGFSSDVDTCYREIFNFGIFSVTPQEPVQMDLPLLQPDMVSCSGCQDLRQYIIQTQAPVIGYSVKQQVSRPHFLGSNYLQLNV